MNSIVEILCKYVEYNDLENVKKLLDQGANPTQTALCGRTAVGIACLNKHVEALALLLNACDNYEPSFHYDYDSGESEAKKWKRHDRDGELTPEGMDDLQWEDEIEQPLPEPAKVDTVDDEWSVLYRYYARIIEKTGDLLANAISMRDPHCLDAYQEAPLHCAASVGSYECVKLLLDHKAPINSVTSSGYTALHLAVQNEFSQIVDLLLQYEANPNKRTYVDQMAPIHIATKFNAVEMIQQLKAARAQVNITTARGQTALHLATVFSKYEAAVKLIQCGAMVNVQDEEGVTPLFTAIVVNDCRMATMLLKNGARLLPSQHLLSFTIRNQMRDMTHLLVEEACENVNSRDPIGWTPLLLAIHKRDTDTLEYLITHGARINENAYVLKELHVAVQQSDSTDAFKNVFRILTRHGVEIDSFNKWGETPLCLAMLMEKYQIAEYLIHEGANVNNLNAGNFIKARDCVMLVSECNNINLIKLFVNSGLKLIWTELPSIVNSPAEIHTHHQRISNADSSEEDFSAESCETYLIQVLTTPLSLKQLTRIVIRNRIIENMKHHHFVRKFVLPDTRYQLNSALEICSLNLSNTTAVDSSSTTQQMHRRTQRTSSILECLIWQLDLPRILHFYLYAFPDVPTIPEDITVFVND